MSSPITGYRKGSTSKVSCLDVASLIAASIARKNRNTIIIPFGTKVCLWHIGDFNPSDSVWTNSNKLRAIQGGGTNCSSALRYINEDMAGKKPNLVIYVSDNESWLDSGHYGRFGGSVTATMEEFRKLQSKSKDAKMVCIDLTPNTTTQAKENKDILNVGGWSDACWDVIGKWVKGGNDFVKTIEEIDLDSCPT
jgi:60 kDa SS-A/Ro ribonucleoprotein